MTSDPILRQVYRAKDKLARQHGGDVHKLCEHLRELAKQHPERMVESTRKTTSPNKRRGGRGKSVK